MLVCLYVLVVCAWVATWLNRLKTRVLNFLKLCWRFIEYPSEIFDEGNFLGKCTNRRTRVIHLGQSSANFLQTVSLQELSNTCWIFSQKLLDRIFFRFGRSKEQVVWISLYFSKLQISLSRRATSRLIHQIRLQGGGCSGRTPPPGTFSKISRNIGAKYVKVYIFRNYRPRRIF